MHGKTPFLALSGPFGYEFRTNIDDKFEHKMKKKIGLFSISIDV